MRLRRRSEGATPPRSRIVQLIVPGARSSARPISLTDSPRFQRSHSSRRSCAEYSLRLLANAHLQLENRNDVALTGCRHVLLSTLPESFPRDDHRTPTTSGVSPRPPAEAVVILRQRWAPSG